MTVKDAWVEFGANDPTGKRTLDGFLKDCIDDCVNAKVKPEPEDAAYLRTVRMEADRIAAEYVVARGWDCTGWDLVKVWADIEAARVRAGERK